jgi:hypothetical protein
MSKRHYNANPHDASGRRSDNARIAELEAERDALKAKVDRLEAARECDCCGYTNGSGKLAEYRKLLQEAAQEQVVGIAAHFGEGPCDDEGCCAAQEQSE